MGKSESNNTHAIQAGNKAIIISTWQHRVVEITPLNKYGGQCSFNGVQDGDVSLNDRYLNKVAVVKDGEFTGFKDVIMRDDWEIYSVQLHYAL